VHRRWTDGELQQAKESWRLSSINGATLVSPFIHPEEKAAMREGIEPGVRIIVLTNEPMGERFKPAGKFFDLCAQGRLLILHPLDFPQKELTRADALALNCLAEEIVGLMAQA